MQEVRDYRWVVLLAGAVVVVLGVLGIWLGTMTVEEPSCISIGAKEGQGYSTSPGFSPPLSIDCDFRGRGADFTESYFPSLSYGLLLGVVLFTTISIWFALKPTRRTAAWWALSGVVSCALVVLPFLTG